MTGELWREEEAATSCTEHRCQSINQKMYPQREEEVIGRERKKPDAKLILKSLGRIPEGEIVWLN